MTLAKEQEDRILSSIRSSIEVKRKLLDDSATVKIVGSIAESVLSAMKQGKKLFLFGNGGSAADAQHIAAEFVGRFAFNRPALPAMALSVNTSSVTAIGNDYGFELVFARQVEAFGSAGDVAIGISTSGNSANVLHGVEAAKRMGMVTAGLTSMGGGKLRHAVDLCICVPSDETPRVQECHILIGHIISELVEEGIFPEYAKASQK